MAPRFGEKEAYMGFMNEFLEHNWSTMRDFLQSVANPESSVHMATYDGYVDLALELATLHLLLCDIFSSLDQATQEELEPLPTILTAIKEGTPVPVSVRLSSTTERRLTAAEGTRKKDLERLKNSEEKSRELVRAGTRVHPWVTGGTRVGSDGVSSQERRLSALEREQAELRGAITQALGHPGRTGRQMVARGWDESGDDAQATSV
ncbi:ras protein activator like-3 [Limosa lapponica baueri]|uniref:Ras protein activator like-3 n=1 Tax=Limosa lapponica baueri TaxID=1758121 RepID=A0A2I0T678_LIMLA|nr:ras protein activator like-3 [Limosa lapponica baueri]